MKLLPLIFAVCLLAACSPRQSPKKIFIVRHAEKQLTGTDPELTYAGTVRATKLAQILSDQDIKHVFSTDYIRAKKTAEPTATKAGVEIQRYQPSAQEELVQQLKSLEGNILVVGHSNTVSKLANEFVTNGDDYKDLEDLEYNFIYEVTLGEKESSVSRKTFRDY